MRLTGLPDGCEAARPGAKPGEPGSPARRGQLIARECVLVEELDGVECDAEGARADALSVLEVEKATAQLFFVILLGRRDPLGDLPQHSASWRTART